MHFFYKIKTFSIWDEKSSVIAKLLKKMFEWFQTGFDFYIIFVEYVC